MCAIVDANVAHEVFGPSPHPAGRGFLKWVNGGTGRVVADGKLLRELTASSPGFRQWAKEAVRAGRLRTVNADEVESTADQLQGRCRSDDPHVIALAHVGGARLLYSNDKKLQSDFKTKHLIDNPRGKVYSTLKNKNFTTTHKDLLARSDLCAI